MASSSLVIRLEKHPDTPCIGAFCYAALLPEVLLLMRMFLLAERAALSCARSSRTFSRSPAEVRCLEMRSSSTATTAHSAMTHRMKVLPGETVAAQISPETAVSPVITLRNHSSPAEYSFTTRIMTIAASIIIIAPLCAACAIRSHDGIIAYPQRFVVTFFGQFALMYGIWLCGSFLGQYEHFEKSMPKNQSARSSLAPAGLQEFEGGALNHQGAIQNAKQTNQGATASPT